MADNCFGPGGVLQKLNRLLMNDIPAGRYITMVFGVFDPAARKLTFANGNPLAIGDMVEMLPSHCDTTINLYDVYHVTRGGRVVAVWPIAARGRVQ